MLLNFPRLILGRSSLKSITAPIKSLDRCRPPVRDSFQVNLSTSTTQLHKYLIPPDELRITYSSSSGPGGQNVNKLETKVDVRYIMCIYVCVKFRIEKKLDSGSG